MQPPLRVISFVGDREAEQIQVIAWNMTKDLYPLLWGMGNKEPLAAHQANHYLNGVFNRLKTVLQSVDEQQLNGLRKNYHQLLQANNGTRYKSLVAAFPELITRKRIHHAADFSPDQITLNHLSYMIMVGCIGRIVPLFREVTGLQAIIYAPDNTITSSGQRSV